MPFIAFEWKETNLRLEVRIVIRVFFSKERSPMPHTNTHTTHFSWMITLIPRSPLTRSIKRTHYIILKNGYLILVKKLEWQQNILFSIICTLRRFTPTPFRWLVKANAILWLLALEQKNNRLNLHREACVDHLIVWKTCGQVHFNVYCYQTSLY